MIGYSDGIGAVVALHRKGYNNVIQMSGCELWLKIITVMEDYKKLFYLVGGKQEVIEETVKKLHKDFMGCDYFKM